MNRMALTKLLVILLVSGLQLHNVRKLTNEQNGKLKIGLNSAYADDDDDDDDDDDSGADATGAPGASAQAIGQNVEAANLDAGNNPAASAAAGVAAAQAAQAAIDQGKSATEVGQAAISAAFDAGGYTIGINANQAIY